MPIHLIFIAFFHLTPYLNTRKYLKLILTYRINCFCREKWSNPMGFLIHEQLVFSRIPRAVASLLLHQKMNNVQIHTFLYTWAKVIVYCTINLSSNDNKQIPTCFRLLFSTNFYLPKLYVGTATSLNFTVWTKEICTGNWFYWNKLMKSLNNQCFLLKFMKCKIYFINEGFLHLTREGIKINGCCMNQTCFVSLVDSRCKQKNSAVWLQFTKLNPTNATISAAGSEN